ncbi:hypothetical protein Taro_048572, partial [Colocasia esculenta]|nr:hypothetical protein [Colocasia esculenta]
MLQKQSKIMQNWSSSVDTSSGSVDTRDRSQNNFLVNLGQCVDTSSSSVDTRGLPRTPFGLLWDSVSTLAQFVPGSSSEVVITSADSRIRVVDGLDLKA